MATSIQCSFQMPYTSLNVSIYYQDKVNELILFQLFSSDAWFLILLVTHYTINNKEMTETLKL